ncbi:MAG: hypothetical protein V4671_26270 [Armatimonadota bacterium]
MEAIGTVSTPEECVEYVNQAGLCLWTRRRGWDSWPSLESVTPWFTTVDPNDEKTDSFASPFMMATWFWKDDLHIEKKLYYGQILGNGIATLASLEMLPYLIAAQGDNDARTLYEKNRLSYLSLQVYEHIEKNGVTASNKLPVGYKDRSKSLIPLQQRFLLTKHSLTGRTRGKYGYNWGLCEEHFPEAFRAAAKLSVAKARETVCVCLAEKHGLVLSEAQAAKAFHWNPE